MDGTGLIMFMLGVVVTIFAIGIILILIEIRNAPTVDPKKSFLRGDIEQDKLDTKKSNPTKTNG